MEQGANFDCAELDQPIVDKWQLWRQDDNGNKFLVDEYDSEELATEIRDQFEARGHKQTYWLTELFVQSAGE